MRLLISIVELNLRWLKFTTRDILLIKLFLRVGSIRTNSAKNLIDQVKSDVPGFEERFKKSEQQTTINDY